MQKSTQELLNELKRSPSIQEYFSNNENELIDAGLKEYLDRLLDAKKLTKSDVIAKSGLNQIYAYQIFAGKKAPSRDKVIALGFGMSLLLDEMQRLLKIAGVSELYARVPRDSVILFALEKRLDVMACDELLYELGEYTLS